MVAATGVGRTPEPLRRGPDLRIYHMILAEYRECE